MPPKTRRATSRTPTRFWRPSDGSAPARRRLRTSATRRSTSALRRRRVCSWSASRGAGSTAGTRWRARTWSSTGLRSSLASSRTAKTVEQRIDELRELLTQWGHAYHVVDDPVVDDATYDRHYDELVELETAHPELVTADSPTQRVGAPPSERFRKVEHLAPMGSLEKVTTEEALVKWAHDVRARLDVPGDDVAWVIEPKIDGSAVSLVYEDGVLA